MISFHANVSDDYIAEQKSKQQIIFFAYSLF